MDKVKLMLGDNMDSLKKLEDNSVDSIVTDPPYGLSFMNKKWDYDVPSVEFWKEVYRVLKPGGYILSFGGTRTYHRMVINIEDAGFEIRDQIQWIYGSGFPKSLNVGKAVDKIKGNDREVIGVKKGAGTVGRTYISGQEDSCDLDKGVFKSSYIGTKGNSEFEGFGSALKPANEPICLARKPLSEKSIAENVIKWRTGGINIDGCRIGFDLNDTNAATNPLYRHQNKDKYKQVTDHGQREGENVKFTNSLNPPSVEGRFPANIILECTCDEVIKGEKGEVRKTKERNTRKDPTEYNSKSVYESFIPFTTNDYNDKGDIHTDPNCPCYIMDKQSGMSSGTKRKNFKKNNTIWQKGQDYGDTMSGGFSDNGGASRFFYQSKVSKAERNMGLDDFEEKTTNQKGHGLDRICGNCGTSMLKPNDCHCENPNWIVKPKKNTHPTLKPVNLMSYLCRLITPKGGIILDPFMGSGSTGISSQLEGFNFIGMELSEEYFNIAEARINSYEKYKKFIK